MQSSRSSSLSSDRAPNVTAGSSSDPLVPVNTGEHSEDRATVCAHNIMPVNTGEDLEALNRLWEKGRVPYLKPHYWLGLDDKYICAGSCFGR